MGRDKGDGLEDGGGEGDGLRGGLRGGKRVEGRDVLKVWQSAYHM